VTPVAMNAVTVATFAAIAVTATVAASPEGANALGVIGLGNAVGLWLGALVGTFLLASRVKSWRVGADVRFAMTAMAKSLIMAGLVVAAISLVQGAVVRTVTGACVGLLSYFAMNYRAPELRDLVQRRS
jgi:hypothetical protein